MGMVSDRVELGEGRRLGDERDIDVQLCATVGFERTPRTSLEHDALECPRSGRCGADERRLASTSVWLFLLRNERPGDPGPFVLQNDRSPDPTRSA